MATADSFSSGSIDSMTVLEVVENRNKAISIYKDVAESATSEALLMLPSGRAVIREYDLGILQSLIEAANKRAVRVRIICPFNKENENIIKWIKDNAPSIKILNGNESSSTVLVVDNKKHFRAELQHANAEKFPDAIGHCIYSNSLPTVQTFKSFFELLWSSCSLNLELKLQDQARRDFVNMASHEIRTPIMPILANAELLKDLYDNKNVVEGKEEVESIMRNALRLQQLTDDLLDAARIDNNSLELHMENVNLHDLLFHIVEDFRTVLEKMGSDNSSDKQKVALEYKADKRITDSLNLSIDRFRVSQVVTNLISNAIDATKDNIQGTIIVTAGLQNEETMNFKEALVSVMDSGKGIDKALMPRLFEKFASASTTHKGTGLGLYISKGIVEAHGGRIWGQNNDNDRGATFAFTLPLDK
jgi:signal transduction histidine kinase